MNKNSAKFKGMEAAKSERSKKEKSASERLQSSKNGSRLWVGLAIVVVVLLAGGFAWLKFFRTEEQPESEELQPVSDRVEITNAQLSDGKVHFFSTKSEGVTIKYMAVKDETGTIRTAFAACDVCYKEKKGYTQVGDEVKCLNCGKTFPIKDIGVTNKRGGCEPGYLANDPTSDGITIKLSDLSKGRHYFA